MNLADRSQGQKHNELASMWNPQQRHSEELKGIVVMRDWGVKEPLTGGIHQNLSSSDRS